MAYNAQKSFSSHSYTPSFRPNRGRVVYPSILSTTPFSVRHLPDVSIDPKDHAQKSKERQHIAALNNKFVSFIDKVRHLQQQNKILETRLKLLLEQETYEGNIEDIAAEIKHLLRGQVDALAQDRQKLKVDLTWSQEQVDQTKKKYEDEIQKKNELEDLFLLRKKEMDNAYLDKVGLELDLENVNGELDFLTRGYMEEIKELQSQIQNAKVVLQVEDSQTSLDVDNIVQKVKSQYEEVAARNRDEAELWHKKKMDDMTTKVQQHQQDVQDMRKEIGDLLRHIQRLSIDQDALKRQRESLQAAIQAEEDRGQLAQEDAREKVRQLEEALNQAKGDMARQVQDYQALMNIKLALDIEIATYRKLLEGEEGRLIGKDKSN